MRRVVAGPESVDVVLLHQQQVGPRVRLVEHPAELGMGLVPVHPPERQLTAVDQQHVAADLDGAEADLQADRLARRADRGRVAARLLRAPRLDRPDGERRDLVGAAVDPVDAELGDDQGDRVRGRPGGDLRIDRSRAVGVPGAQPEVVDGARGPGQQGDVAEDPRQPPLVLVLQIAGRRPLVDPDQDDVLPGGEQVGDVELLDQSAAPADPDLVAVQPDAVDRLHAVEPQQDPLGVPVRAREAAPVVGAGVLVGDVRGIDRERVLQVGVDRVAVRTARREHPVLGYGHRVPLRVVEVRRDRGVVEIGVRRPAEPPVTVEAELRCVGPDPGPSRAPPTVAGGQILDVGQHPGRLARRPRRRSAPPTARTGRRAERSARPVG